MNPSTGLYLGGVYVVCPDCVDTNSDGKCDPCEAERAALEDECGGPDLYVIDEETCQGHYDDSQDSPDTDSDGTSDVCDPCPDNADITQEVLVIYRLNRNADVCGSSSTNCDGTATYSGNTGSICQAAETKAVACEAVRGNGAQCTAKKDSDGDGIPDDQDSDDDNDGTPDNTDNDDDGDGIPDSVDKDTDTDGDGIPDKEDPDHDQDGDGIPDQKDDDDGDNDPDSTDHDDDNDGIPDAKKPGPFDPGEIKSTLGKDLARILTDFLSDMKQTSMFSIPNQVLGGVPSGGSASLTINGGETFGVHEFDFSSWSSGLAGLRAVFYIYFSILSVRIVVLKR